MSEADGSVGRVAAQVTAGDSQESPVAAARPATSGEPDHYHGHEALHVAHVLQNMVAHELEGHPFVTAHPTIAQQVERVQRELGKLYQSIGAIHLAG